MNKPKRPRDPNQLAKLIADIATGDAVDAPETVQGQDGGTARAASLTPERRREIAQAAARRRWSK